MRYTNRKYEPPLYNPSVMGAFAICFALVFVATGCGVPRQRQISTYSPPVVLTLSGVRQKDNLRVATIEMKNVSDQPLWYTGLRPYYPPWDAHHPTYSIQCQRSNGGWDTLDGLSGFGTDFPTEELAPGQIVTFVVSMHIDAVGKAPFRIGVDFSYSSIERPDLPDVIYWSNAVAP